MKTLKLVNIDKKIYQEIDLILSSLDEKFSFSEVVELALIELLNNEKELNDEIDKI